MSDTDYRIQFEAEERTAIAERIRDGIGSELSEEGADGMVEAVGVLLTRMIQSEGDADEVIQGVGDRIVEKLEGDTADELVQDSAEIILSSLPGIGGSMFLKRPIKRIVRKLMGDRSDEVVQGIGDKIIEKLVENGHADQLVDETMEIVVRTAIEEGYADDLVDGTLDEGLESIVEEGGVERIAEDVESEFPADSAV